jgi:hypothetical protein
MATFSRFPLVVEMFVVESSLKNPWCRKMLVVASPTVLGNAIMSRVKTNALYAQHRTFTTRNAPIAPLVFRSAVPLILALMILLTPLLHFKSALENFLTIAVPAVKANALNLKIAAAV